MHRRKRGVAQLPIFLEFVQFFLDNSAPTSCPQAVGWEERLPQSASLDRLTEVPLSDANVEDGL